MITVENRKYKIQKKRENKWKHAHKHTHTYIHTYICRERGNTMKINPVNKRRNKTKYKNSCSK